MTVDEKIMVWLPSPMGDTILATPALRALRQHFDKAHITFYASAVTRQILSPCSWNDAWIDQTSNLKAISEFKTHRFTHVVLFKNSFGSALACFLARIPMRIGYARDKRSWLLTHKVQPKRLANGAFEPNSMVDYYLDLCSGMGVTWQNRMPELSVDPTDRHTTQQTLPNLFNTKQPIVILVPGGAFGPSKCWPVSHYAQLAKALYNSHHAQVVISVAPNEQTISQQIAQHSNCPVTDLGQTPLSLGQLKALFEQASLVISNDTGPRHIAIALKRHVITLFGPNDPKWTDTQYEHETQIMAPSDCVCCQQPVCKQPDQHCMTTITVDSVHKAACKHLSIP